MENQVPVQAPVGRKKRPSLGALVLSALRANGAFIAEGALAIIAAIVFASQFNAPTFVSVLSVGITIAIASLAVSGLFGFIFGVPRSQQHDNRSQAPGIVGSTSPSVSSTSGQDSRFAVNTNLEQISDWLTKILVGVGLTQIGQIPDWLGKLAAVFHDALGKTDSSGVFGIGLMLYSLAAGFLQGYIWTRFYFEREARIVETLEYF